VPQLVVKPLDPGTWADFAALVEANNGVWGGCWCMGFHSEGVGRGHTPEGNRAAKQDRVEQGRAHAALVFDGADCLGWCQFGPTDELPLIKRRRAYEKQAGDPPDWRITCFFVGKGHRGKGVADAALGGALHEIARLGGGVVESYPESVEDGRTTSGSVLHNATLAMFERHGFERDRLIGKHHWVVRRTVHGPMHDAR
jgi:GNAT superfamily N-acetyltransferase